MDLASATIAIDVSTPLSPWGALLRHSLRGVLRFVAEHPEWEIVANGEPLLERGRFVAYEDLKRLGARGLIAYGGEGPNARQREERLAQLGLPVVLIGGSHLESSPFPCVAEGHEEAGRLAAEHLLDRGHRHFAYFGNMTSSASRPRFLGMRKAAGERGRSCHWLEPWSGCSGFSAAREAPPLLSAKRRRSQDPVESIVERWLNGLPKPVGVMAHTDRFAQILIRACGRIGLKVPDDVAIVGAGNNSLICEGLRPALSTVDMNDERIGYEAARLLLRIMKGEPPPASPLSVSPRGVIVRASSDAFAVDDAPVARALRFMQKNLGEPIGLEDICEAAAVSCATLETRFRKALGRTVNAELLRQRLERAQRLMIATDLTLAQIAQLTGFRPTYFHNVFASKFGVPPGRWRRQRR